MKAVHLHLHASNAASVTIVSEMHSNAFHCIAQHNTSLHDCILSLSQHLRSRHFTGLCKSVYPWGHVSEIQSIKGANHQTDHDSPCQADTRGIAGGELMQFALPCMPYSLECGASCDSSDILA